MTIPVLVDHALPVLLGGQVLPLHARRRQRVEFPLVAEQILGQCLHDDPVVLDIQAPVSLIRLRVVRRAAGHLMRRGQRGHLAAEHTADEPHLEPVTPHVRHGRDVLCRPQRMPAWQSEAHRPDVDPLGVHPDPVVQQQGVATRLETLGVEVVLGEVHTMEPGLFGHEGVLTNDIEQVLEESRILPDVLPFVTRRVAAAEARKVKEAELHRVVRPFTREKSGPRPWSTTGRLDFFRGYSTVLLRDLSTDGGPSSGVATLSTGILCPQNGPGSSGFLRSERRPTILPLWQAKVASCTQRWRKPSRRTFDESH